MREAVKIEALLERAKAATGPDRDAVSLCRSSPPGEYSIFSPSAACDSAQEWIGFLEGIGASKPKVLPGDDSLTLTWRNGSAKLYLTISEDGSAELQQTDAVALSDQQVKL